MQDRCVVVLDVGKTLSKLTIWSADRQLLERRTHRNSTGITAGFPVLDVKGIGFWLAQSLSAFAHIGNIAAIVPVGHGAAACLIDDDGLCLPPLDYEAEPPSEIRNRYVAGRDPFSVTGSPSLPDGLNLGVQLLWLETIAPEKARRARIVTWPQYWAWRLCGTAATEVSSLGCHTDLWMPLEGRPSPMAVSNGWAERLAPLRKADEVLGVVSEEWRSRCSLPADCVVLCGVHDSNAALLAVRGYPEVGNRECTILSTGTWFVAMRSVIAPASLDAVTLPEGRDCLYNVDVAGRPVPSARFMGGREVELLEHGSPIDLHANHDVLLSIAKKMIKDGVFALPSFQKGVGPFPDAAGHWLGRPSDQLGRRAVASLYLALMTNVSLDLIGSKEILVIEGRFADDAVFTGALAALRADQKVYLSDAGNSLPYGALRLFEPTLPPQDKLVPMAPLDCDLTDYAASWQSLTGGR